MRPTAFLWIALAAIALMATGAVASDHGFTTIYLFKGSGSGHDGSYPAALIADPSGTVYGTTLAGGYGYNICGSGCGTLFKIAVDGKKRTLRTFSPTTGIPSGNLALDSAGNLFWTTPEGGKGEKYCRYGCGTVHEYGPSGKKVIQSFANSALGYGPSSGVILDSSGNLYGTTRYASTVFRLSGNHDYHGTVLHGLPRLRESFPNGLVMDGEHNLYGTTQGINGDGGLVFELAPDGDLTVLHAFNGGNDGKHPRASLVIDESGSLYGTTYGGGQYDHGTVYQISSDGTEAVLHAFTGKPDDGSHPLAALLLDSKGNLYGTTSTGGASGKGTVFKLAPDGTETLLHSFSGDDGASPVASLIFVNGYLYGTAATGGNKDCGPEGCGTVFRLKP